VATRLEVDMPSRFVPACGSAVLVVLATVAGLSSPRSAAAQSPAAGAKTKETAAAKAWAPPRTPDGQPDLQGVWISISATPLERPAALKDRPSLTDEEVVELQRRADRIFKTGNSDFAAGDGVFLAALENREVFKSVTSTHGSEDMVDREFDHHTSLIVDPEDGRIPPLTAEARQRQAAAAKGGQRPAGPEDLTNALRCLSWSVPRLGGRYGAGDLAYYQIFQTPGYVVLYLEVGHEARIIPLDGRPHLPASVRQWSGDSRGRWEGNTLVVETTNFSPNSNFMGAAEQLHLVERFTRIADDRIKYEMTVDDATTWTRPWKAEMPLKQSPVRIYEYACHEGNATMVSGMLLGARADERALEAAKAK
jgi:hypothetical protein